MSGSRLRTVALVTCQSLPRPDHELPPLVQAFADRGVHASVVAWDDPQVAWASFDCALLRSTWNYVQEIDRFRSWLDVVAASTRLVNDRAIVAWNEHKRYLLAIAKRDVPIVPTHLAAAGEAIAVDAIFAQWGDIVLKPAISAGSFQTIRVAAGDVAAVEAYREANRERDLLVQPLLEDVLAHGERNLVYLGGQFSHAVHKGARWKGDREASGGLVTPSSEELALGDRVLAVIAESGLPKPVYARVDTARDRDDRVVLMELELIEPSLFLDRVEGAAARLVDILMRAT